MQIRCLIASALAALLAGCATLSPDGGRGEIQALVQERLGAPAKALTVEGGVDALLREPLTADAAVEIALRNNPGLQARLAEVGVADADLVQAGSLRNPVFAYTNKRNSEVVQIDRSILVNVAALLTMPLALEIEQRRFAQAKLAAASEVVATVAATREAYFRAVAAQEMAVYYGQVKIAAGAGRDLARRMADVGNFTKLAQMREELFFADATVQLARAQQSAVAERERLIRMLGFADVPPKLMLPARLPDLPAAPISLPAAEQTAMDKRLDVRLSALETEGVARTLGLTKATRFVNVLDAGYVNESESGNARKDGYEITLELPLFDWGTARLARAEAQYRQAVARTAEAAVVARSEVRAGYAAYRIAYELAKHHRDEVVPLRKRIADEAALRYNAMLIGVFELLADAREQVASVNTAIEATRDFWLADTALQLALAGRSAEVATSMSSKQAPTAASTPRAH
jgi:outer membrane protein TolC